MKVIIIAETSGKSLHPVTSQLVGAACSIGGEATILCPGGIGVEEAAAISGALKVISVEGGCFETYDCGAWAEALGALANADMVMGVASPTGRELILSVYVADFKLVGKSQNLETGWKLMTKSGLVLEEPTPLGDYLGCGQ